MIFLATQSGFLLLWVGGVKEILKVQATEIRSLRESRHEHANRIMGLEGDMDVVEEDVKELKELRGTGRSA